MRSKYCTSERMDGAEMIIEKTEDGFTTLHAQPGHQITNGELIGDTVCLGILDSKSNWTQITDEEAEILQQELDNEIMTLELPAEAEEGETLI